MRGTSEQEWLIPAIGLTLLSGTFALAFLPDYSGILPSLELLPWWLIVAALAWAVCGPVGFFPMTLKGVRNPLQHLGRSFIEDWKAHLTAGLRNRPRRLEHGDVHVDQAAAEPARPLLGGSDARPSR